VSEPIARGRTSDILATGDDRVLKLFAVGSRVEDAEREARLTRLAREAGAPAPIVFGVSTRCGRPGIELERLCGPLLLEQVVRDPACAERVGVVMARVHAQLHRTRAPRGFPSLTARLRGRVAEAPGLDRPVREALLARVHDPGDEVWLCHGDFHPANLVASPEGTRIIDWCDATAGPPEADVARTLLIVDLATTRSDAEMPQRTVARRLRAAYLREYLALTGRSVDAVARWTPVVAAARLCERIAGETRRLHELVAGCAAGTTRDAGDSG